MIIVSTYNDKMSVTVTLTYSAANFKSVDQRSTLATAYCLNSMQITRPINRTRCSQYELYKESVCKLLFT